MNQIIEHSDSGNGDVVRVGDSQLPVSVKVYQDIYHQITGRSEQVRRRYSDNLLIDFAELQQLHHKVTQLCDVHHVLASNESISIFHDKERKEQFTSFERFRLYNANSANPTVSVVLKYNFSIVLGGQKRPQEYIVNIRLTSKVAVLKQIEDDVSPLAWGRVFYSTGSTAEVTVDYADYVVARGFMEAFDEWVSGCKSNPKNNILTMLRRYSHLIPEAAQLLVASSIIYFALQAIPIFFSDQATPSIWARFSVIYSGCAFVLIKLVSATARQIENAIDSFPELSYLNLNKGDEKIIAEASSGKGHALLRFTFGAISSIFLGILSTKLEKLI